MFHLLRSIRLACAAAACCMGGDDSLRTETGNVDTIVPVVLALSFAYDVGYELVDLVDG